MSPPAPEHVDLAAGRFRLASMRSRLHARIVDAVVVGAPLVIVDAMLFAAAASMDNGMYDSSGPGIGTWALMVGLGLAAGAAYEVGLTATQGATIGKRTVGIRVARADRPGEPDDGIGVPKAFTRYAALIGLGMVCAPWGLLCSASPCFDRTRRQGWHDRAAKTYVLSVGR